MSSEEVTLKREGRQYGASYHVIDGMLHVKTHTETRTVELRDQDPMTLARGVLEEIVNAQFIDRK